jgi:hypothetical protein
MTRARIYGILADYVDQNDHGVLRSDPIFKLICGRSIHEKDLASQPTLSRNARLKKLGDSLLKKAVADWEKTSEPQRLFTAFSYQADSRPAQRWLVVKREAHAQGTNRRVVVTNRPGAFVLPGAAYDGYADRGESENRNKELKCGLQADRLSDHRYFANLFRLYHAHLIAVPSGEDGLRLAIGEAHECYTRRINFRERWRGYLWQGRFAPFVMDEPYLLAAARYVELNPVRAGLVASPGDWPWSSAGAHRCGREDQLVKVAPLLAIVGDWSAFLDNALSEEDLNKLRRRGRTGRPLRAIESKNFYPAPSAMNCSGCPYREQCRSWNG